MPAYRSSAEAEIRDPVVDRLRKMRPNARIIHEICASHGGCRMDVIAVDRAEIIAVEIKSKKDKLARLPDQITAMRGAAHHVIAALHEKFLPEQKTSEFAMEYERDGEFYRLREPQEARHAQLWRFPEPEKVGQRFSPCGMWKEPSLTIQVPLPPRAIDILWRDELYELCGELSVPVPKRATMKQMLTALRWSASGRDLTLGICRSLRRRKCVEADPPIHEATALEESGA